ncbi:copper chaperone CopZ [Lysinibacillus parviboronicapiens]|uniref:Copper chaperone CopZ n=1 Tax=Lysinibacillus parviboronicapiens TaxID=436516 RepID=A0ABV2PNJ2_9BACI
MENGYKDKLHTGEAVLTAEQSKELLSNICYEKTVYIGDVHVTESIEGAVNDVIKVLEKTNPPEVNNITVNVAPNVNVEKVVEQIRKVLVEEVNKIT